MAVNGDYLFPEIMCNCSETELDLDVPVRHGTKTHDAPVALNLPEESLMFDRVVTSMHHPSVAGEQFRCALIKGIGPAVDLYGITGKSMCFGMLH